MNFTNLKYFSVLAEELNFTRAAKRLYISQQALSSHINKLEQHYQSQLFIRTTPLELTPAGQCLYLFAKETLIYEKMTAEKIHTLDRQTAPQLSIATTLYRGKVLLPAVLPAFQKIRPDVKIDLIQSTSGFVEELLLTKKADVIIGNTLAPRDSITSEFLFMDTVSLYFTEHLIKETYPEDWEDRVEKLREHCDLKFIEKCRFVKMLDSLPLGKTFKALCQDQQIVPNIYLELRAIETMAALCFEHVGAMICPDMFVVLPLRSITSGPKGRIYKFPLPAGLPASSVSVAYQKSDPLPSHIADFVRSVKKTVHELL